MIDLRGRTLRASFFHAPIRGEIEFFDDALVAVGDDGKIVRIVRRGDQGYDGAIGVAEDEEKLVTLPPGTFVLPGFVDLHIHAPQYPQLGEALDVPLEVWLGKYTFPLEAQYADLDFARPRYEALVGDLLANGTTTALYFATVHQ